MQNVKFVTGITISQQFRYYDGSLGRLARLIDELACSRADLSRGLASSASSAVLQHIAINFHHLLCNWSNNNNRKTKKTARN
jgi:hypothetical protein